MESIWLYHLDEYGQLLCGDSKKLLEDETLFPDESIDMVMTSPPYWALRDYHADGQLGQEPLFKDYINNLAGYFDEVYRILKHDGTLWVNIGDTYYGSGKGSGGSGSASKKQVTNKGSYYLSNKGNKESELGNPRNFKQNELRDRSLCQIPARFAIAMQDRGWILRNDVIWHKPNQMPTSAKNRFSMDYEHLFFFTKTSKNYYFIQQLEPAIYKGDNRGARRDNRDKEGLGRTHGVTKEYKNKRSVWSINTQPIKGSSHFAKYPEKLIEIPIVAGCPERGTILDPFFGSGTTGIVAERLNRKWIGIELNPNYCGESIDRVKAKRKQWLTELSAENV